MAKILVADDNSNIQKMVGLALKDQGIDVVAVGNGEAAVRKISDVRPDLVLADVFMPVRNGYEVCKYVKDDSALSHIPVILLVGAFDPLDEQEAQRVGADGVLKKPFVPPDPLISMVKSALARAGVSVNGAKEEKVESAPAMAGADMIAPRTVVPAEATPPFGGEPVSRPPEVKIGSEAPVAFGSLLETPATAEENDTAYIAPAPAFADERNWGTSPDRDNEEEADEEESSRSSWRRDGGDADLTSGDSMPSAVRDWRDSVTAEAAAGEGTVQGLPVTGTDAGRTGEAGALPAAAPWLDARPTGVVVQTEIKAAVAEHDSVPAAKSVVEAEKAGEFAQEERASADFSGDLAKMAEASSPMEPEAVKQAEPETAAGNPWFSTAPSPWDAEVKKASQLASTWDVASEAMGRGMQAAAVTPIQGTAGTSDPNATQTIIAEAEQAGLPESAVESIREEAAEVAETATTTTGTAGTVAEPKIEDLVAKVLAKMSPDVLQAVTREILKPVIEAIVRDEVKK